MDWTERKNAEKAQNQVLHATLYLLEMTLYMVKEKVEMAEILNAHVQQPFLYSLLFAFVGWWVVEKLERRQICQFCELFPLV